MRATDASQNREPVALVMPETREVIMSRPTIAASLVPVDDDDTPTRAELIEALGNLRVKSEAEYVEWQRLVSMNYIGMAKDAKAKWESTLAHMDNMLDGIQFVDAIGR